MIDESFRKQNVALFSKNNDLLDLVYTQVTNEKYNVVKYQRIDEIIEDINDIQVIVIIGNNLEYIKQIKSIAGNKNIIVYNKNVKNKKLLKQLDIEYLEDIYILKKSLVKILIISKNEEEIRFKEQKAKIVNMLIESIAHKIQANLLVIGATMDVSKLLINYDIKANSNEKEKLVEEMYKKNARALDEANILLELMAGATSISQENIMTCDDIIKLINLVMNEYLNENNKKIKFSEKIKKGEYICGPINDLIFVICGILEILLKEYSGMISFNINEDENLWYFEIDTDSIISESIATKIKNLVYDLKFIDIKILNSGIILKMYKNNN